MGDLRAPDYKTNVANCPLCVTYIIARVVEGEAEHGHVCFTTDPKAASNERSHDVLKLSSCADALAQRLLLRTLVHLVLDGEPRVVTPQFPQLASITQK